MKRFAVHFALIPFLISMTEFYLCVEQRSICSQMSRMMTCYYHIEDGTWRNVSEK